jgi:hypothetical protein
LKGIGIGAPLARPRFRAIFHSFGQPIPDFIKLTGSVALGALFGDQIEGFRVNWDLKIFTKTSNIDDLDKFNCKLVSNLEYFQLFS